MKRTQQFGTKPIIERLHSIIWSIESKIASFLSTIENYENNQFINRIMSWKFSNEQSRKLDISNLLNKLKFHPQNNEANALCHLFLLEIVIDRMIYFMFLNLIKNHNPALCSMNFPKLFVSDPCEILNLYSIIDEYDNRSSSNLENLKITSEKELMKSSIAFQTQLWLQNLENSSSKNSFLDKNNKDFLTAETQTNQNNYDQNASHSHLIFDILLAFSRMLETFQLPSELSRNLVDFSKISFNNYQEVLSTLNLDIARVIRLIHNAQNRARKLDPMHPKFESFIKKLQFLNSTQKSLEDSFNEYQNIIKHNLISACNLLKKIETKYKQTKLHADDNKLMVQELNKEVLLFKRNLLPIITDQIVAETSSLSTFSNAILLNFSTKNQKIKDVNDDLSKVMAEKHNIEKRVERQTMKFLETSKDLEKVSMESENLTLENTKLKEELEVQAKSFEKLTMELEKCREECEVIKQREKKIHEDNIKLELEIKAKKIAESEMKKLICKLEDQCSLMAEYPDLNGPIHNNNSSETTEIRNLREELNCQIRANELRITILLKQTKKLKIASLKLENA